VCSAEGGTSIWRRNSYRKHKENKDSQGLGVTRAGSWVIGQVNEIVGEGGTEVSGFVATKDEVLQIVRYWATEIIDLDFEPTGGIDDGIQRRSASAALS
jgi:hypothetical protein